MSEILLWVLLQVLPFRHHFNLKFSNANTTVTESSAKTRSLIGRLFSQLVTQQETPEQHHLAGDEDQDEQGVQQPNGSNSSGNAAFHLRNSVNELHSIELTWFTKRLIPPILLDEPTDGKNVRDDEPDKSRSSGNSESDHQHNDGKPKEPEETTGSDDVLDEGLQNGQTEERDMPAVPYVSGDTVQGSPMSSMIHPMTLQSTSPMIGPMTVPFQNPIQMIRPFANHVQGAIPIIRPATILVRGASPMIRPLTIPFQNTIQMIRPFINPVQGAGPMILNQMTTPVQGPMILNPMTFPMIIFSPTMAPGPTISNPTMASSSTTVSSPNRPETNTISSAALKLVYDVKYRAPDWTKREDMTITICSRLKASVSATLYHDHICSDVLKFTFRIRKFRNGDLEM